MLPAAFTPGNILVANTPTFETPLLFEYTPSGQRVQALEMVTTGFTTSPRDITIDSSGLVQMLNAARTHRLSAYDPVTEAFVSHTEFAGWSTGGNLTYGAITAYEDFVFVTDHHTANGEDRGIIRFDTTDQSGFRRDWGEFVDVNIGLDGLLYALGPTGSPHGRTVEVFDPDTFAHLRTITMPRSHRALAVDENGHIYAVDPDIWHYDPNGVLVDGPFDIGFQGLGDIDIDVNHRLLVASHGGYVGLTDTDFSFATPFNTRKSTFSNFAAFVVDPVAQIAPRVSVSDAGPVAEGEDVVFTVSLTKAGTQTIHVSYSTSNLTATASDDYTSASGTVTFAPGETSKTITVGTLQDTVAEGAEQFRVTLTGSDIADGEGVATIADDDIASFSVVPTGGVTTTTESGGVDTLMVALNVQPLGDVVVDVTATDSSEVSIDTTSFRFTSLNWNQLQTVTVRGVDDSAADGDQTTLVRFSINDAESDDVFDAVADQLVPVVTTDDDVAGFSLSESGSGTEVAESGTSDTFTVVLDAAPPMNVTFIVSSSDPGEVTVSPMHLQFTSANWNVAQTVTVTGEDDSTHDGDQTVIIAVAVDPTTSDVAFRGLGHQSISVTNGDDDQPPTVPVLTGPWGKVFDSQPTFEWIGPPDSETYRLFVRNLSTGEDSVIDDTVNGTSFRPASTLPMGRYRVWAKGYSASGDATDWSAPLTFRIMPRTAITGPGPRDAGKPPVIRWHALPGATSYELWMDNLTAAGTPVLRNETVSGTEYQLSSSLPLALYRVWVRGVDDTGHRSAWSHAWNFFIRTPPSATATFASTFDATPTFNWTDVPGAASYEIWLLHLWSSDRPFLHEQNLTTTSFTPSQDLPDGPYRWWVRASSSRGIASRWSTANDVFVGGRPVLSGPVGVTADPTPTFSWLPVDGANRYELQVDRIGGPTQVIFEQNILASSFTPETALSAGTYRFRVRAISTGGAVSPWSRDGEVTLRVAAGAAADIVELDVDVLFAVSAGKPVIRD